MTDRRLYAFALILLLITEALIALYVHDRIVRPYIGDALAVMLAYAGFRALFGLGFRSGLIAALLLACAIETGQAFHLIDLLGLQHVTLAHWVLGQGFDWADFALYGAGGLVVALVEAVRLRR